MKTIDEMLDSVAERLSESSAKESAPKQNNIKSAKDTPKTKSLSVGEKRLTLDMAQEIARAVRIAARIIGVNAVVAIVNEGANLVLLNAMDESYIASVRIAQDKAYTAAALRMSTSKALEMSRGGALDGLTNGNGIMLLGGGEPLEANGKLFGGIGVSGGTKEQDIILARTGAQIFKIKTEKEGLR